MLVRRREVQSSIVTDRPATGVPAIEPRSSLDDVIDSYKKDVDRALLREALSLTPAERMQRLVKLQRFAAELRAAGKKAFG